MMSACYPDDGDDTGASDATDTRRGRPGVDDDTGGSTPGDATDGSGDSAEIPPAPEDATYVLFDDAWAALSERIAQTAFLAACPCMLQFGMASSQADCESQLLGQLQPQLDCIEAALRSREASALGYANCQVPVYDATIRCYDTADIDCLNMPECGPDEAALATCEARLTTAQRETLDRCTPDSE
jgi:hypothetical protein